MALLAALRKKAGQSGFPADEPRLHQAFYNIRDKFPELLPDLTFDTRGLYVHSDDLENILNVTQLTGSLERSNPSGTRYRITEEGETLGLSVLEEPSLTPLQKRTLKKAAQILEDELLGKST